MAMKKLIIKNEDNNEELECLFNPTEYTIAKAISWDPKKQTGKNVGKVEFTGGAPRTINFELLFDVFEEKDADVNTHVNKLWAMAMVDEDTKQRKSKRNRPPFLSFTWGAHWSFKATITSLSVRYTLFRESGTPCRATATVQLQEYLDPKDKKGQNPTSRGEAGITSREVRPHDTLAWIAFEEYGDATLWRHIASANNIEDPLGIEPGQVLAIPRL